MAPASDSEANPYATGPLSLAIFSLARTHRALAADLLRPLGLHPGQELLLMFLWEHGPQRQTDLAQHVATDSASMTRTVQRLERSGFVRRRPSPDDRRVTLVEPTPASLALRPRVGEVWAQLERATAGDLGPVLRDEAATLLRTLEQNVGNTAMPATSPPSRKGAPTPTPRRPAPSAPGRRAARASSSPRRPDPGR
ncbi:DNA-binding MarR family transcriptional regulator [Promicromonospora iranensis]|uniref:DNA-binding MarR family transcriptional regulator n=1 Tax=Promicromonospora iranensis TaxID=1105144 RepID=A0ABU2CWU4_9MICO|nr:DNA-binding MarR family transcriptional regulator [Promicromonospora iranensis]